jgi:hypothetical protein
MSTVTSIWLDTGSGPGWTPRHEEGWDPFQPIEKPHYRLHTGAHVPSRRECERALREALGDIELGAFDYVVIGWLRDFDTPTVATLISLILRSRAAERALALNQAPGPDPGAPPSASGA